MKEINLAKTRILIFQSPMPIHAYDNLLKSINTNSYEVVALIDNECCDMRSYSTPVISFAQITDFSFWDLLIINDSNFEEDISEILNALNIPEERYFFLRDRIGQDEIPFYRSLFDESSGIGKILEYSSRTRGQNYFSVTTQGGEYITHASDRCISAEMFLREKSYSQDEIDLFVFLAEKYYGFSRGEKGYFFDIGANIGTTCIYVKKYLVPQISIIAFEPIYKNYRLLYANIILNDIADYRIVNKAVSDTSSSYNMFYNVVNPGGSSIVSREAEKDASGLQAVESVTIDEFIIQNKIEPAEVKYVWIDTEGFEANVLKGAVSLLKQDKIAFWLEYSPVYTDVAKLTEMADLCKQYFQKFICADDFAAGDTEPRPIDELYELYKRYPDVTNIFLIK